MFSNLLCFVVSGTLATFDKHLNCVLTDAEETRSIHSKVGGAQPKKLERTLGFVLVRGETVMQVECLQKPAKSATKAKGSVLPKLGLQNF